MEAIAETITTNGYFNEAPELKTESCTYLLPALTDSTLTEIETTNGVFSPYINALRGLYSKTILSLTKLEDNLEQNRRYSNGIRYNYGSNGIDGSNTGKINLLNLEAKTLGEAAVKIVANQLNEGYNKSSEIRKVISSNVVFLVYHMTRLEDIGYMYKDDINTILNLVSESFVAFENVWSDNLGGKKNKFGIVINNEIATPNLQHAVEYINTNYFGNGSTK